MQLNSGGLRRIIRTERREGFVGREKKRVCGGGLVGLVNGHQERGTEPQSTREQNRVVLPSGKRTLRKSLWGKNSRERAKTLFWIRKISKL